MKVLSETNVASEFGLNREMGAGTGMIHDLKPSKQIGSRAKLTRQRLNRAQGTLQPTKAGSGAILHMSA